LLGKCEALLDKHFPGEQRSSLLDIEINASLALTFGHPLIANGLRPVSHNYVTVGMMNCKEAMPLSPDLQTFMYEAKDGVIFVSFG
jgi:hypothetical protein